MTEVLSLLGSVASIGSIPLAVYLYLRTREARYAHLREKIKRIVSYQIGEGRSLSSFEIMAVIDSETRAARIKKNLVSVNEVVEDLVSETISSAMLAKDRKAEILDNLREIHSEGVLFEAFKQHRAHLSDTAPAPHFRESETSHQAEGSEALEEEITSGKIHTTTYTYTVDSAEQSGIWAAIAGALTAVAMLAVVFPDQAAQVAPIIQRVVGPDDLRWIALSVLVTLLSTVLWFGFSILKRLIRWMNRSFSP